MERKKKMEKRNGKALLPIFVFVVLYLGLGILFEYGLRIEMGFYKIPVVVIFLIALLVACLQNRALQLNDKLAVMGTGISDPNIITMILIFMLAGIFVGVVGRSSANSVAYFILSLIPPQFAVAVLFIVSCLVSLAMGTSVGTITLIVPIGIAVAKASGFSVPLCIASVMSGAMFGDNLSFISDTTIAACNGQGCKMTDKFKEHFFIALPAAIVSVIIIFVLSVKSYNGGFVAEKYNLIQTIPYILVLIGGIVGLNVFLVLIIGVISGSVIMIATGMIAPTDLLGNMGTGAAGMFETSMVAILVAAICALIKEYGGFAALLHWIKQVFKGRRGGLLGMGLLVGPLSSCCLTFCICFCFVVHRRFFQRQTQLYSVFSIFVRVCLNQPKPVKQRINIGYSTDISQCLWALHIGLFTFRKAFLHLQHILERHPD